LSAFKRLMSGRREEPQLWSKITELNGACVEAVRGMEATFALVASGDRQSALAEAQKVGIVARKGMAIAREARKILPQTSLPTSARDDVFVILESLHALLLSSKEGHGALVQRRISPSVVFLLNDVKLQYTISKLFEKVTQTTLSLTDAINSLPNDPAKSSELSLSAKKMMEDVESARSYLLERLYEQEKSIDVLSLLQLKDIVSCESSLVLLFEGCSESVRSLATTKS
jgi:uncharacterized protein Yka (UPF0111/DUF47 family)